jgi:quercetin dioxygenase-like cupin family protein
MGAIHKCTAGSGPLRWADVAVEEYPRAGVTKQVLIGPAEGAQSFALRYFEVAPGAVSALDEHAHDHGVAIVRGRGTVLLGEHEHAIAIGDVIYVAPGERHQFRAAAAEALGFLCIVPPRSG